MVLWNPAIRLTYGKRHPPCMVSTIGGKTWRRNAGGITVEAVYGISCHPWIAGSTDGMQRIPFIGGCFYRRRRHLEASLVQLGLVLMAFCNNTD